jgi:hypothetical protein
LTCCFSSLTCDFSIYFECLNQRLHPDLLNRLNTENFLSQSPLWINFKGLLCPQWNCGFGLLEALKNQWLFAQWLLHLSCCWMILVWSSSFANHFRIPLGWEGLE